jgi:hypothetical protein
MAEIDPPGSALRLGTDVVLSAVESAEVTEEALGGLARYFGSHELHRSRRSDAQKAPPRLRETLLAYVKAHPAGDNLERLESAWLAAQRAEKVRTGRGLAFVHPDRSMSEVAALKGTLFAVDDGVYLSVGARVWRLTRRKPGSAVATFPN